MDLGLKGKRVVVTGGSRGIGFAIAEVCAAEGAAVSVCARGTDGVAAAVERLRTHGGLVHGQACDVGDAAALAGYVDAAAAALDGLDVLVNNPSGFGSTDDEDGWKKGIDVDLMGVVRATWAARPHLEAAGGGAVLNISSISGVGPSSNIAYGAVKAAVVQLTQSHAMTLAGAKIRVNCIAPGSIEFPGGVWARRKAEARNVYDRTLASIPFGRMGLPEEIGRVAAFLVSDAASWVTGQTVSVDGGQNLK